MFARFMNEEKNFCFVIFQVIWWIAFCRQRLDPRNHTRHEEKPLEDQLKDTYVRRY